MRPLLSLVVRPRRVVVRTEEAFLAAVSDQPDDDTPRLVYADWLEERGHHLCAELIRLQCRIANGSPYTDEDEDRKEKGSGLAGGSPGVNAKPV